MLDAIADALGPIEHANTIPYRRFVPMSAASNGPGEPIAVDNVTMIGRALVDMAIVSADQHARLTPLTGGVSSDIYRADLPQGVVCVKRALPQL